MSADSDEVVLSCFVVMPITTPAGLVAERYGGNPDHFRKIFLNLIEPAVVAAGLIPIPPLQEGTQNIQARIINDLQGSDLVLADLSTLNPNVFLEVGIRTALDKPVCFVHDGNDALPFDSGTLNTYKYNPQPLYELNSEIATMSEHIRATLDQGDGRNELWKYFGSASNASLPTASLNPEDASLSAKVDRIIDYVEAQRTLGRRDRWSEPKPGNIDRDLGLLAEMVTRQLARAGSSGIEGATIAWLAKDYLGNHYDNFVEDSESLGEALHKIGVRSKVGPDNVLFLDV